MSMVGGRRTAVAASTMFANTPSLVKDILGRGAGEKGYVEGKECCWNRREVFGPKIRGVTSALQPRHHRHVLVTDHSVAVHVSQVSDLLKLKHRCE